MPRTTVDIEAPLLKEIKRLQRGSRVSYSVDANLLLYASERSSARLEVSPCP